MAKRFARLSTVCSLVLLAGCFMGDPKGPVFGYRIDHGKVVVVYPLCRTSSVQGAAITVANQNYEFKEIWGAEGPVSEKVKHGEFVIGDSGDFARITRSPRGPLPDTFYVEVTEEDGEGLDDFLDYAALRRFKPSKGDALYTSEGMMTREQIARQLRCDR